MNFHIRTVIVLFFFFSSFLGNAQPLEMRYDFPEKFNIKISYGWITIGEAQMSHQVNDDILTVDLLAYTTGIVNWIARLKDSVHTEINKYTLKPKSVYMDRNEGKYQRREDDYFDFNKDSATIHIYRSKSGVDKDVEVRHIHLKDSTYDMLSSYLYLRSRTWDQFSSGDSLMFNMFYEGKYYPFGVEYIKKDLIKTKLGEFMAHQLYVLFPISRTFPEKHMVKVWISDDKRQLPLYLEAKMKFGKAICELVGIE